MAAGGTVGAIGVTATGTGGIIIFGGTAAGTGIGTTAVVAPGLTPGVAYPALLIDGTVYVARFHAVAYELAGGAAACGTVQKYGMVILDATGKVIQWAFE